MKNKFTVIHFVSIVFIIVFLDQFLKIYIKTNFFVGQEKLLLGSWLRLHFIENPGMAYGLTFGSSQWAKIILSSIRFIAIIAGIVIMIRTIKKGWNFFGFICWSLVIAGALGNLIDSMFYGIIFNESGTSLTQKVATFLPPEGGYSTFFLGNVVDMIYAPMFHGTFPNWSPLWAGEEFEFFSPIFNIADSSISVGMFMLLIFMNKLYPQRKKANQPITIENSESNEI